MATTCTSTIDIYESVPFCMGEKSLPGTRPHFYFVRRDNVTKLPKPSGTSAKSLETVNVISDNIELASDEEWFKVDLVDGESEPTVEQQGSWPNFTFLNKCTLVLPGTGKKVTGLISLLNNDDIIALIPQRDGKCRLFGNSSFRVSVKPSQAWGKAVTDANTTTIEIEVSDEFPAPFYIGTFSVGGINYSGGNDEVYTGENIAPLDVAMSRETDSSDE